MNFPDIKDGVPSPTIFGAMADQLNLGVGFFLTVVCFFSSAMNPSDYENIAVYAIILSGVHGGLSFSLLLVVKRIRTIVFVQNLRKNAKKLLAVAFFISAPLVLFQYFSSEESDFFPAFHFLRNFIISFASTGHYFKQMFGISSLYNIKIANQSAGQAKRTWAAWTKQERYLISVANFFAIMVFPLYFARFSSTVVNFSDLAIGSLILSLLVSGFVIFKSSKILQSLSHPKSFYLFRSMAFPFFYLNPVALAANKIIHSMEYVLVYRKIILSPEARAESNHKFTIIITLFLCFFIASTRLATELEGGAELNLAPFLYFHFGINIALHYWTDHVLYEMKDKSTRNFMGSVLMR